jgi:hypothetical protein
MPDGTVAREDQVNGYLLQGGTILFMRA